MKKAIIWAILAAFLLSSLAAVAFSAEAVEPAIRVTPKAPLISDAERQAELAKRRAAVAAKMPVNSILVMWAAEPRNYAGDVDFQYRQENNFYYLTALKQQNSALVLVKDPSGVKEYLFLPKRNPQFETWNGKMYSNEDATRLSGIKTVVDAAEKNAFLTALSKREKFKAKSGVSIDNNSMESLYLLLPDGERDEIGNAEYAQESKFRTAIPKIEEADAYKVANARPIFDELRLIKSPYEMKLLQHAVDISIEAHMRAQAIAGRAEWEYQVQAEVEYVFRRRNADYWGYSSIVGCGPNATTLHYVESQSPVKKGQLLLMDVAAEYDHYTADITRTFPVNGKFTKEQAEIYQIVYDAQEAAANAAKPGVTFSAVGKAANDVITDGLLKLGLITAKDPRQVRFWYMHGLGHWIGMNVHDVGGYSKPLAPGMVFTNEPGIYVREDALDYLQDTPENKAFLAKVKPAFEKYKGIGVRIEDDLLVTDTGVIWMTKALPRSIADIEAFMAKAPKEVPYTAGGATNQNLFVRAASH
jgi:Xaa-Pro aminopeptidase